MSTLKHTHHPANTALLNTAMEDLVAASALLDVFTDATEAPDADIDLPETYARVLMMIERHVGEARRALCELEGSAIP